MIEIKSVDGTTLSAQALEHGFVRIRAGGYDGYRESLLERYGFVNRLGPDTDAVETGNDVSLPDGLTITLTDSLGFDVRRKDERLFGSLPHTKVATFPTIAGNSGYQLDLPIVDNEKLIGFGDHQREQFLLNGMRDTLWIEYPVKHVPVPFFMSNRGYGVFFNTTRKLHFDFGVTDSGIARFAVEGDFLDIFIVTGDTYEDMIDSYCKLTGYPGLPPLKSLGLWLIMHTRATGHDVLMFAKTLRDAGIPCDNISLEPDWMQDRYDFSVNKEWSAEKFRGTTPDSEACRSSRINSRSLSTDWTQSKSESARFDLLLCRCPTRCHSAAAPSASIFGSASCTRFSPTQHTPAAIASAMRSGDTVFDTAISVISSGDRPARAAASAIRPRTSAKRSSMLGNAVAPVVWPPV